MVWKRARRLLTFCRGPYAHLHTVSPFRTQPYRRRNMALALSNPARTNISMTLCANAHFISGKSSVRRSRLLKLLTLRKILTRQTHIQCIMGTFDTQVFEECSQALLVTNSAVSNPFSHRAKPGQDVLNTVPNYLPNRNRHGQCRGPSERKWILNLIPGSLTKNPPFPLGMMSCLSSGQIIHFLLHLYRFPEEHDILLVLDHLWYCRVGVTGVQ